MIRRIKWSKDFLTRIKDQGKPVITWASSGGGGLRITAIPTLNAAIPGLPDVGDTITYAITVTNTSDEVTFTNVTITSDKETVTCTGGNPILSLAPGASVECSAVYTIVGKDTVAGSVTIIFTASGDDDASASVSVTTSL
jgi:hypothetical protein